MKALPQLAQLELFIIGESYAGASVPALASRIHQKQRSTMGLLVQSTSSKKRQFINLKGIGLGNAQVSQELQWRGWYETGCLGSTPLFNSTVCKIVQAAEPGCEKMMSLCGAFNSNKELCDTVLGYCRSTSVAFLGEAGLNPYDFRKKCDLNATGCYKQIDWLTEYLNSTEVKEGLGIDEGSTFQPLDMDLYARFEKSGEMYKTSLPYVSQLLSYVSNLFHQTK